MQENNWGWAKSKKQSQMQRKMFIKYGNASWLITLPVLLIFWPIGLLFLVGTFCIYAAVLPNLIHEKMFLQ